VAVAATLVMLAILLEYSIAALDTALSIAVFASPRAPLTFEFTFEEAVSRTLLSADVAMLPTCDLSWEPMASNCAFEVEVMDKMLMAKARIEKRMTVKGRSDLVLSD